MKNATVISRWIDKLGRFAGHLAHGGLLTAGLFALAVLAANQLEGERAGAGLPRPLALAAAQSVDNAYDEAERTTQPVARVETAIDSPAEAEEPRLSREMVRVKAYVARRYRVSQVALEPLLAEAENVGGQLGLDPMLLVAMIAIESSFNPFAESSVGAQGLMQVIPRFHMDKIGDDAGKDALFDPQLNIRVGALVLKEGLARYGTLQNALQYYGGALNDPKAGYANKVFAMKAKLKSAAGRAQTA